MDKRIETVLGNKEAKAIEYFGLVNFFTYSTINVYDNDSCTVAMDINKVDELPGEYEFSQNDTATKCTFSKNDIVSVSAKMHENEDIFIIDAMCKDNRKIAVTIFNTSTNTVLTKRERYYEMDYYALKDYLDDNKHHVACVHIRDEFGLDIDIKEECAAFIEESEEENLLCISNTEHTKIEFPLVDDCCNEMYIKNNESTDFILIKPYGQPFMEITLMVRKDV